MMLAFKYTRWQSDFERLLNGNGYLAAEFISVLTVSVVMLIPQIMLLMPLYAPRGGGPRGGGAVCFLPSVSGGECERDGVRRVHVLVLQHETGGGHDPGALVS